MAIASCVIIGRGNIGLALKARLEAEGHRIICSINTRQTGGLYIGNERAQALSFNPDDAYKTNVFKALDAIIAKSSVHIAFIAISTRDCGEKAVEYILYFVKRGIPGIRKQLSQA
jgi:hypothetical protein